MISLPAVFASHALYQQNAALHFRGTAAPSSRVEAILRRGETVFCRGGTTADDMGGFQLPLPTPPASFEPWELIISDGEDTVTLEDLLFGELWMAAGQSNMEMGNNQMPGAEEVFETLQTCHIRFFQQMSLWDRVGGPFPFEPQDDFPGCWHRVQEWEAFGWLSACATAMARAVYRVLNRTAQVPLGIIDSNMGATYVEDWLPKDSFFKDPVLREWMETAGQLPSSERWDTYGDINYLQPSAMFNTKTYPLHGIQVRGILWYQGEGNTRGREHSVCYRRAMEEYHRVYAELFQPAGVAHFPVICSQLFPWRHVGSGECRIGYINQVFSDLAAAYPGEFAAAPVYDLSPAWAYTAANHPVHPLNKYPLGERMASLALAGAYGEPGLRTAAALSGRQREGGRLTLTFSTGGQPLECRGNRLKVFFLCDESGLYQEAQARLLSPDKVVLSHPYIAHPLHTAYQFTDMARGGNLWCGGMPVAPFATDTEHTLRREAKPWLDLSQEAVWIAYDTEPGRVDCFYRPTWQPLPGSALCRDDVFCETGTALHLLGQSGQIGAFVQGYPFAALDLYEYRALRFDLFAYQDVEVRVAVEWRDPVGASHSVDCPVSLLKEKSIDWAEYEVEFILPERVSAERLLLLFGVSKKPVHMVNLDALQLLPWG